MTSAAAQEKDVPLNYSQISRLPLSNYNQKTVMTKDLFLCRRRVRHSGRQLSTGFNKNSVTPLLSVESSEDVPPASEVRSSPCGVGSGSAAVAAVS